MTNASPRRRSRPAPLARGPERLEDRTTPNVAFAVDAAGLNLLTFDTATPGTVSSKLVTGLVVGDVVSAIDVRPFDGQLYAFGLNAAGTSGHLYRLDAGTGVATQVGATTVTFASAVADVGFDFNPVVDRVRLTTNTGENMRLNPNDGTVAGTDTKLSPDIAEAAVAYDRNLNFKPDAVTAAPAGTLTTLFGINPVTDQLVRIGGVDGTPSPNGGAVTNVGPLGVDVNLLDGFDVVGQSGTAFAVLSAVTGLVNDSKLYTIDLTTGAATLVGSFPTTTPGVATVRALAVLPSQVVGTTGNDQIELAANPTVPQSVLVTINGVPKGAFGNSAGSPVSIQALDGDDTIRLADGLQLPSGSADGGPGTDTLDYSLWTTGVAVNLSDITQGDFLLRASLDGAQEVPPTASTAKGTATFVFNSPGKTFDLRMDVTGITLANLTGSHVHSGLVGVDGPIIVDLGDGTQWDPTATGIARTVFGMAFPAAETANLLSGKTYLNVHTKAETGGEIRGQLVLVASVTTATGFGVTAVTNFENATGGAGDDVMLGSDQANTFRGGAGADVLIGRGGKDLLVGDKGSDQLSGDLGDDTLVWNDGDGSDLMEGGAGTDTVQVNGGTADETFTTGPDGDRVTFSRSTGKNFTLDIGSTETLILNGNAGADTVTVAPSKTTAFLVNGGDPTTAPGDALAVNVAGVTGSTLATPSGTDQGKFTFPGGFQPVTFNGMESFAPVATPFAVGPGSGTATARVFSPGGTSLFDVTAFDSAATGGVRVAMGDFNGDGVLDLVAGTGPGVSTLVRIFDGVTKAELFAVVPFETTFTGGVFVAAGDVNGDGRADLAISPDEGGGPRVRVFSGNGFGQIADFLGIEDPAFRGGARAALGDLNGDGADDLIVAAGFGGGPRIAAFSGKSLGSATPVKLFGDFLAFEAALRNGTFVTAGDVDGDGKAELIAGGGPGGGPRVTVFDGADLLTNVQTRSVDFFAGDVTNRGGVRLAVKDLDGDARADLIAGAGTGAGSRVTAYAGSALAGAAPPELFHVDAFAGLTSGVFVG